MNRDSDNLTTQPAHVSTSAGPRGWLRHGNPPGDPSRAPRCGAKTRTQAGRPCRAPCVRGKRRCRLHGGRSTGPTSAAGLARIRATNTRHGRFSREQLAVVRRVRTMQRNGVRSARALPVDARAHFTAIAQLEAASFDAYPVQIREHVRAEVRTQLAAEEQQRLARVAAGRATP